MKSSPKPSAEACGLLPPREAERNRLALEWIQDHWNEIEDAWTQADRDDLKRRREAWIEAGLKVFDRNTTCPSSRLGKAIAARLRAKYPDLADANLARLALNLEQQAGSAAVTAAQEQRRAGRWDRLGPLECAARLRAAEALALEAALTEALECLPDETSSSGPG